MQPRRKTITVCRFCGGHFQDDNFAKHLDRCVNNPHLRGCGTCKRGTDCGCKLGLIPIDFKTKSRTGRYCPSWRSNDY